MGVAFSRLQNRWLSLSFPLRVFHIWTTFWYPLWESPQILCPKAILCPGILCLYEFSVQYTPEDNSGCCRCQPHHILSPQYANVWARAQGPGAQGPRSSNKPVRVQASCASSANSIVDTHIHLIRASPSTGTIGLAH